MVNNLYLTIELVQWHMACVWNWAKEMQSEGSSLAFLSPQASNHCSPVLTNGLRMTPRLLPGHMLVFNLCVAWKLILVRLSECGRGVMACHIVEQKLRCTFNLNWFEADCNTLSNLRVKINHHSSYSDTFLLSCDEIADTKIVQDNSFCVPLYLGIHFNHVANDRKHCVSTHSIDRINNKRFMSNIHRIWHAVTIKELCSI